MRTAVFTKLFADRDLEETVSLVADRGFDAVEPMCRNPHLSVDTPPERVDQLREQLDGHGLDVACLGTYTGHYDGKSPDEREAELDDLSRFLEMADTLGCDLVRHNPGGPPQYEASDDDYTETADWMRRAADMAAEHDIRLTLELHGGSLAESATGAMKLLDLIDRPNYGVTHDAGNMYIADVPFGHESIETLRDRILHVHVKGERRIEDPTLEGAFEFETRNGIETFQHTLLDEGANCHEPVFEALRDIGYDGYASVECHRQTSDEWTDTAIAEYELDRISDLLERAW